MNKLVLFAILSFLCAGALGASYDTTKGNDELRQAFNAALLAYRGGSPPNSLSSNAAKWYGTNSVLASDTCANAAYPATSTANGTLANVVATRTLNVCAYFTAPNRFTDSSSAVVGFDVDTLNAIAQYFGTQYNTPVSTPFTINNINTPFADLLTNLNNGACHIASGGLIITSARAATNAFSCNVTSGAFAALVLQSNAASYSTIAAVAAANITVGVLNPSTQYTFVTTAFPGLNVTSIATTDEALTKLQSGEINAWVTSELTATYITAINGSTFAKTTAFGPVNNIAFALRKDATAGATTGSATTGSASGATTGSAATGGSTTNASALVVVAYVSLVVVTVFALLF